MAIAQEEVRISAEETTRESDYGVEAVIRGEDDVELNKSIIFSASNSVYDQSKPVKFTWDVGDGTVIEGEEIVHIFKTPGKYIVSLTIEQEDKKSSVDRIVFVYEEIIILITDVAEKQKKIFTVTEEVKKAGALIKIIDNFAEYSGGNSTEVLVKKLKENIQAIGRSELIIIWPERTIDFSLIAAFFRETINENIDYKNKTLVFITGENIRNIANYSQSIFDIIEPRQIVVTREDAFTSSLLSKKTAEEFIAELGSFTDFKIINKESRGYFIFNPISGMVQYMLKNGIPGNTLVLILIFPIIVTIIAFCRQVLGIMTFGIFTPSIIALSFIPLTLKFGVIIFLIILFAVTLVRVILSKFRLLYIPKVAITLTGSSLIILLVMAAGTYYQIADITTLAIFPMLIMTTISEKFVQLQTGKGIKSAVFSIVATLLIAVISCFIVTRDLVQAFTLSYPGWIFLAAIILNVFLGKYTGLRLTEYFRFREIFRHMEE